MGIDTGMLQNVALIAATMVVLGIAWKVLAIMHREAHGQAGDSPEDLLAQFQAAYDAGEMDSAEFRRVCASLERKAGEASRLPAARPRPPSLDDPRLDVVDAPSGEPPASSP